MSISSSFKRILVTIYTLIACFFPPIHALEKDCSQKFFYQHIITDVPQSIHVLNIDPSCFEIVLARALDDGIGRETVSSLSSRHCATAAINGGFFQIGGSLDGLPMGILKIRNNWFSLPCKARGAIGWSKNSQLVLVDQLVTSCCITTQGKVINVDGINRQRKKGEKILYTPAFHKTTLTNSDGIEVIVKNTKIDQIVCNHGSNFIPDDGWILSVDAAAETTFLSSLSKGIPVALSFNIIPQSRPSYTDSLDWSKMDYVVGGAPVLVRNGTILTDFSVEKISATFLTKRHARTAIGLLKDNHWVFVVVDGNLPGISEGMTMNELAQFMAKIGSVEALNLDGGGSSSMVIHGAVVNKPAVDEDEAAVDGTERRVSDAILILG